MRGVSSGAKANATLSKNSKFQRHILTGTAAGLLVVLLDQGAKLFVLHIQHRKREFSARGGSIRALFVSILRDYVRLKRRKGNHINFFRCHIGAIVAQAAFLRCHSFEADQEEESGKDLHGGIGTGRRQSFGFLSFR